MRFLSVTHIKSALIFLLLINAVLAFDVWSRHGALIDLKSRILAMPKVGSEHAQAKNVPSNTRQNIPQYAFGQADDTKFVNLVYTIVRQAAENRGIRVTTAAPGKIRTEDGHGLGEIRVSVQGRYADLMNFLEDLRLSEPSLYAIDFTLLFSNNSLVVQRQPISSLLNASVTFQGIRVGEDFSK